MNIQEKKNYHVHKPQYKVKRVPKIIKITKELKDERKEVIRRRREFGVQYEPWET